MTFPVEHQAALDRFEELLRAFAPKLDLVSPGDLPHLRRRHVEDSLRALPLFEGRAGPFADVGSGAGLPGVPLAIATGAPWRLFEPRRRRAAFLEEVVRELDLDCEVVARASEDARHDAAYRNAHEIAIARALAPPARAFSLLLPLVCRGGMAAVFVGERASLPPKAALSLPGVATLLRDGRDDWE